MIPCAPRSCPRCQGHHKYKAQGDVYGAIVDALEKELPPEVLRTRTASLNVLSSLDAMQLPIHNQFCVSSCATSMGASRRPVKASVWPMIWRPAGSMCVRLSGRPESYPPDLHLDKQPGDYSVTRFQEGSWSYVTRFYGRDGTWKGDYASVTTPIAIFSDQLHLVNLHVTGKYSPSQPPETDGSGGPARLATATGRECGVGAKSAGGG